ncbi:MAG TPA: DivIVA domain-containing protein [Nocardioidaceae bacterium]
MPDPRGTPPITADELEHERSRLTRVRTREGYDAAEVDDLLERLVRELGSPQPTMTAEDVDDVRLTPVRIFHPGYDMGEVDGLLDRAARALRNKGAVRPPAAAAETRTQQVDIPWSTVIAVGSFVTAVVVAVMLRW